MLPFRKFGAIPASFKHEDKVGGSMAPDFLFSEIPISLN